jgi:hypothetical protein
MICFSRLSATVHSSVHLNVVPFLSKFTRRFAIPANPRMNGCWKPSILRWTKEMSQYGRRNLPNMERTRSVHIKHMCIISMSPLYVLGSM